MNDKKPSESKIRQLYALLAAWCVFLLAPGILVESGMFGRIDMHSNISGMVALLWIVGYLLQFGVFLWIMNIASKQKMLWWFLASLLPWAVDWTLPVSPWLVVVWVPITIAVAYWIAFICRDEEWLRKNGIRATGIVLEVFKPWMNVVINNVYIKRKVRLRIERVDGVPAYEGILNGLFMLGEIPSEGDKLPLIVDPTKPQRFEYDQDASSANAAPRHSTASFARDRESIADELAKLAELHERGALTESEFEAAKKKLLRH